MYGMKKHFVECVMSNNPKRHILNNYLTEFIQYLSILMYTKHRWQYCISVTFVVKQQCINSLNKFIVKGVPND